MDESGANGPGREDGAAGEDDAGDRDNGIERDGANGDVEAGGGSGGIDPFSADDALREVISARGHEHVAGTHASTLEVTTDDYLTPAGDCILCIEADRAPADFDEAFVAACRDPGATVAVRIEAGGHATVVTGRGDPELSFASDRSHVCRTSAYVDDRTVMLEADRAAADVDRALVDALADGAEATVTFAVVPA